MSGRPLKLDLEPLSFDLGPVNLKMAPIDWADVWADIRAWEPPNLEGLSVDLSLPSVASPFLGPVDPVMLDPDAEPTLSPRFGPLAGPSRDTHQTRVDIGQKW